MMTGGFFGLVLFFGGAQINKLFKWGKKRWGADKEEGDFQAVI